MEPEPHQPCQLAGDSKLHLGKRWQRRERLHPGHGVHACFAASGPGCRLLGIVQHIGMMDLIHSLNGEAR